MLILKVIVLVALIKLLMETENPGLCAGLYTGLVAILAFAAGNPWGIVLVACTIAFLLAFAYFWLLDRLDGSALYWVVLIVGLLIGMV